MKHEELIRQLTLEEKAALLGGKGEWDSRDIPRLNIPSMIMSDGPHGVRRQAGAGDHLGLNASLPATCFPTAATVANSWDTELGEEVGRALGEEAKSLGVHVLLGPGMNIKRSPLCGRNFEYFSEDPYLAGKMAASYVKGIQSQGGYACPKHFAVNSQEERRMAMNAVVDERTLREIYLTAFEIAVAESHPGALMTSYNQVNGEYANESMHLLKDILRGKWGYEGFVVSDWGGANDHAQAVRAGADLEMPAPGLGSARELVEAVRTGKLSEADVDARVDELLEPGASETLSFSIPKEDMASYDTGLKIEGGGYILEAGDYTISLRSDSHTVIAEESFTVDEDISYADGRSSDLVPATNQFEDYARGEFEQLSRADHFANYETATAAPEGKALEMSDDVRKMIETYAVGTYDPTAFDNPDDVMPTLGAKNGVKLGDLTGKSYDDPQWEQLLDQLTFEEMATMINVGGWQTAAIDSVGKIATSDCDGPAGLSNFVTGAYGTAYPAEVLMAQTWNTDLIEEMGDAMAQEYVDANNFGWYGPAMNTHRNAFAGRNFEYYSEDGVLAGKMALAETNGAAQKGVYPYIKHFALNDQETNRCSFLLTWASEQAIREIYLKPFEIATKGFTGTSRAVMSSFNWIGTEPSCANTHLLNNVLRDEWGFVGMVETDYDGSYGYMISDHCVRNGNDLMLGFAMAESNQFTDQSATAALAMRESCKNILYTIGNSGYYLNGDPTDVPDKLSTLVRNANIGAGVCLAVLFLLGLLFLRKREKKA